MMFDINKLTSSPTVATLNSQQGQATKALTGTLAKLSSELKLIASLESIQINSTRDVIFQQKPAQILDVSTSSNKNFSLVNTQDKVSVQSGDKIELQFNKSQQSATLNISTQALKTSENITKSNNTPPSPSSQSSEQKIANTQSIDLLSDKIKNTLAVRPKLENSLINTQNTHSQVATPTANNTQPTTHQNNHDKVQNSSLLLSSNRSNEYIKLPVTIISKAIPLTVLSITTNTNNTDSNRSPATSLLSPSTVNADTYSKQPRPLTSNNVSREHIADGQKTLDPQNKNLPSTNTQQINQSLNRATPTPNYFVEVSDGIETFTIQTRHKPEIGSTIPVIIDNKGQLQLLPKETTTPKSFPIDEGLKVSLPKQLNLQEMTQFIKQLETLSQSNQLGSDKLQQTLLKLIANIPNLSTITTTPDALKQTFQQSGLFLENNLAKENTSTSIDKDIKLSLLKLQAAVSETNNTRLPPQLELVEKAIERITTNQLKHLVDTARNETQILPLQIEIPIKHGPTSSYVQFEIDREEKDKNQSNNEKRRWLVKLKFDFPETGKIEARLSIQENKVGIIFVAEDKNTELKIRSQLSDIKERLKNKDIEIEKLDCFCAPLKSEQKPKITNRLIDVRT
ncbi:flagellar hook-length control protein FliK [Marinomonas sp. 2405UD68-3]|uniref:flagellar hook-length control protein FliK n=1 Tax=Marinomonas sp. 2405UD68-3 TaxID=3391835 RepID=UPI0039C9F945